MKQTPHERIKEVMQGLGKEPKRISFMLNLSKIWYWWKNQKSKKEEDKEK